jgi:hypothetical protein
LGIKGKEDDKDDCDQDEIRKIKQGKLRRDWKDTRFEKFKAAKEATSS